MTPSSNRHRARSNIESRTNRGGAALTDDSGQDGLRIALRRSIPEEISDALEREIVEGRFAAGSQVTEERLSQLIGVSRTPVREAVRLLEAQGLVVRRRGRTYVAERMELDEARAIYEMRAPLEGYFAARAAQRMAEGETLDLEDAAADFQRSLRRHKSSADIRPLVEADTRFHWLIYQAAESDLLYVLRSYWGRITRELYALAYDVEPEMLSKFAGEHEVIATAIRERIPKKADAAMRRHIASGWTAVRASLARQTSTQSSQRI